MQAADHRVGRLLYTHYIEPALRSISRPIQVLYKILTCQWLQPANKLYTGCLLPLISMASVLQCMDTWLAQWCMLWLAMYPYYYKLKMWSLTFIMTIWKTIKLLYYIKERYYTLWLDKLAATTTREMRWVRNGWELDKVAIIYCLYWPCCKLHSRNSYTITFAFAVYD